MGEVPRRQSDFDSWEAHNRSQDSVSLTQIQSPLMRVVEGGAPMDKGAQYLGAVSINVGADNKAKELSLRGDLEGQLMFIKINVGVLSELEMQESMERFLKENADQSIKDGLSLKEEELVRDNSVYADFKREGLDQRQIQLGRRLYMQVLPDGKKRAVYLYFLPGQLADEVFSLAEMVERAQKIDEEDLDQDDQKITLYLARRTVINLSQRHDLSYSLQETIGEAKRWRESLQAVIDQSGMS